MGSLPHPVSLTISPPPRPPLLSRHLKPSSSIPQPPKPPTSRFLSLSIPKPHRLNLSPSDDAGPTEEEEPLVESLKVPDSWLLPSNALQESEWLRDTLHKWLDDEYCPEPANVEISKVAARSYYKSLIAKKTDLVQRNHNDTNQGRIFIPELHHTHSLPRSGASWAVLLA